LQQAGRLLYLKKFKSLTLNVYFINRLV